MTGHAFLLRATITLVSTLMYLPLAFAQAQPPRSPCPELPGDASAWKEQEHWAWKAICEGRNADFQGQYGGSRNPREAQNWPAQRDLSRRFLEAILADDSYRSRIPSRGIVIIGARFRETLNFVNAQLEHDLSLVGSRFEGKLDMRGVEAHRDVVLRDGVFGAPGLDEAINLSGGARIQGSLNLTNADAQNHINMDSLHVGTLSMNSVHFPSLWLANAKIDSQVTLNDSAVAGPVQMTNIEVGKDLDFINSALTKVILRSAKIGGMLTIAGPRTRGDPVCPDRTGPRPNYPAQSVDLTQARIGTLNFGGVCYGPINAPENWGAGARLSLTNASVHTLQDGLCRDNESDCAEDSWPEHLELTWWLEWLKRQAKYSPLPYETLAGTLLRLGQKEKAKDILYASKNRELLEATPSLAGKIWLGLHWLLIGYGYRIYYALWWALAFVVAGVAVLRLSGEGKRNCMPFGVAYSVDMLLPIIHLRDAHYKIDLNGWARYYFYIHKTMGYVLASFLIAGLSGLTR